VAEAEYKNSFDDELRSFKERIRKRAAEKVQEAIREAEEEEKKARLGPGGLDPIEVYESLPEVSEHVCDSKTGLIILLFILLN
jgi:cell division cycle protein 37